MKIYKIVINKRNDHHTREEELVYCCGLLCFHRFMIGPQAN